MLRLLFFLACAPPPSSHAPPAPAPPAPPPTVATPLASPPPPPQPLTLWDGSTATLHTPPTPPSPRPTEVVIWLGGAPPPSLTARAVVVALDALPQALHTTERRCWYPAGDLEAVALLAEQAAGLPAYTPALLAGRGPASAALRVAFAQAPEGAFAGLEEGVAPTPAHGRRPCARRRAPLVPRPEIPAHTPPLLAAAARDDATIHLHWPLAPTAALVLVSGAGGWGAGEHALAQALAARGVGVIGWDALAFFWKGDGEARFTAALSQVHEALPEALPWAVAGYSFGAGVAAAAPLPPGARARLLLAPPPALRWQVGTLSSLPLPADPLTQTLPLPGGHRLIGKEASVLPAILRALRAPER